MSDRHDDVAEWVEDLPVTVFLCGNAHEAKAQVTDILRSFGWRDVIDLGDITSARGTESYVSLWLRLWRALQVPMFNIKVVR